MNQRADWLKELSTATGDHMSPDRLSADHLDRHILDRIARALETLAGIAEPSPPEWDWPAYTWDSRRQTLLPARNFRSLALNLLQGLDNQINILENNTRHFAKALPANNALLWGARGTGKSSLIKSVFFKVRAEAPSPLHLIEIYKEDLRDLPALISLLRNEPDRRFILFLDDLSFEASDERYKSLKSALEGGVNAPASNIIIYATSNRRHLMPRLAAENSEGYLHPAESAEENISLSDRFGLWLGFYSCDQDTYLRMVAAYAETFNIQVAPDELRRSALEWAVTRGTRSGRVAWQFICDLAGSYNKRIEE